MFRGRKPEQLPSLFEQNNICSSRDYNAGLLGFLIDYVEPRLVRKLTHIRTIEEIEQVRIARYIAFQSIPFFTRGYELLLLAEHADEFPVILLPKNIYISAFTAAAAAKSLNVLAYRSTFRRNTPRRQYHYHDRNVVLNPLYIAICCLRSLKSALPGIVIAAIRAVWRVGLREEADHFDIMALVWQTNPSNGFNELFWSEAFRKKSGFKVFGVHPQFLAQEGINFYVKLTDRLERVEAPGRAFLRLRDKGASLAALRYVASISDLLVVLLKSVVLLRISPFFAAHILAVQNSALYYLELMRMTSSRLAWAMVEGNELHSVSLTLAAARIGGVCLGTTWSIYPSLCPNGSLLRNHVFFAWGEHHKNIFHASRALIEDYVVTGYPTASHFLAQVNENGSSPEWMVLVKKSSMREKVVVFYDNTCAIDLEVTCSSLRALYSELIRWIVKREDVLLVVKTKRMTILELLDKAILEQIQALEECGAILVREEKADLSAGFFADVVIGISSGTLACLSAAYGRRCILYNARESKAAYEIDLGLRSIEYLSDIASLPSLLDQALSLPSDTAERCGQIDSYADGRGDERMAFFMKELLMLLKSGLSRDKAIAAAHEIYSSTWG